MGTGLRAVTLVCLLLVYRSMGDGARLLGEVKKVEALLGGKTALPCDVTTKDTNDSLLLLVWYKGNKPFYSYDGRLQKHWRSKDFSDSSRVLFTFHRDPAALLLDRISLGDQGTYRCRADFSQSPTRNSGILLNVIILPSKPFFMDEIGSKVEHLVGPLHEGDTLVLTCLAVGGQPAPKLTWWKGGTLLDSTDELSEVPGLRENQLLLTMSREYSGATIQCLANNNNITAPLSSSLQIDLYVSPETVNILSSKQALSAGEMYELPCYINGSHPLPEVSWWLDGKIITDQQIVTEVTRNEIMSTLYFKPKAEHNGQDLTCLATNTVLAPSHASKLHTMRLNIFFKPLISLSLVTNRYGSNVVREGDVIQLRCMVEANPWITNTEWFANNATIQGSSFNNSGISLSSSDLIILNPSTIHAGNYSCRAYNLEGRGQSNDLDLKILYKPKCNHRNTSIDPKTPSIFCPVRSLPKPVKYYWRIENKSEVLLNDNILISDTNILSLENIQKSLETKYVDEILISCWAANEVGEQRVPCMLYLRHAFRKPDPPKDCIVNASIDTLVVQCLEETVVEQMFGLSIWERTNNTVKLLNNITSPLSTIRVDNLPSGQSYEILVYSFNKWGESETVKLFATTAASLPVFDKTQADIGLWSGVALGLVLTITLVVIIFIIKKKTKTVINDGLRKDKRDSTNARSEKTNYITSSNADNTEKPLLYKNGKTINGIILTRNNSEPKIIEDLKEVQNRENEHPVPPSISRLNKPKLPKVGGKSSKKCSTLGAERSFKISKHKKEIKTSNGSIPMHDKSLENMNSTLQNFSMSKESIV